MDSVAPRDGDFKVDLESGVRVSVEDSSKDAISAVKIQANALVARVGGLFVDGKIKSEEGVNFCNNGPNSDGVSTEHEMLEGEKSADHTEKKVVKEKRKKTSNKKPPKPPRPPSGQSFDAADQKLIKEISEFAMLKRARIERMKKKMKASKTSSSYSNVLAMVFTILFCLVIIFHGFLSRVAPVNSQGSPLLAGATEGGLISVLYFETPSASHLFEPGSGSPKSVEPVAGSDDPENLRRAAG